MQEIFKGTLGWGGVGGGGGANLYVHGTRHTHPYTIQHTETTYAHKQKYPISVIHKKFNVLLLNTLNPKICHAFCEGFFSSFFNLKKKKTPQNASCDRSVMGENAALHIEKKKNP